MMTYEEFKMTLADEANRILKEKNIDAEASFAKGLFQKNHQIVKEDIIAILPRNQEQEYLHYDKTGVRLSTLYQSYQKNTSFPFIVDTVMRYANEKYVSDLLDTQNTKGNVSYSDRIFCVLLDKKLAGEELENVLHRTFFDMVMAYFIKPIGNGFGYPFPNILLESEDIKEEELFSVAVENARLMFTPKITRLSNTIMSEYGKIRASANLTKEHAINGLTSDTEVYVCNYNDSPCGSSLMLDNDFLHNLSKTVGGDMYILPTSIMEFMAIKAEKINIEDAVKLLEYFNENYSDESKHLTDSVYYFSQKDKKLYYGAAGKSGNSIGRFTMGMRITNGDIKFD